jgi:Fur family ferric uptake transcriptional regulator
METMCVNCDYEGLLKSSGLKCTPNRLHVLRIIGNSPSPLSAQELLATVERSRPLNRVTMYRILDSLVESKLVDRISAGDRSFRYGLAHNPNHPPHPHFYCTTCGNMVCLDPGSLERIESELQAFLETFPALIERMEIRLDGTCKNCLRKRKTENGIRA